MCWDASLPGETKTYETLSYKDKTNSTERGLGPKSSLYPTVTY